MLTRDEGIAYLTQEGNYRVPCSRYGRDTEDCAEVAWAAYLSYVDAAGETDDVELETLHWIMGLVVNDHDDIAYLLNDDPLNWEH